MIKGSKYYGNCMDRLHDAIDAKEVVNKALPELTLFQFAVAYYLSEGVPRPEIERRLGLSQQALFGRMQRMKKVFTDAGALEVLENRSW